jgi:glycosyltransferase involved in cell wall biosynthesis
MCGSGRQTEYARYSRELALTKYGLGAKPGFLPSPIRVPEALGPKSPTPMVCYLGRWDSRKRPELFLQLAEAFPHVRFIAIGRGRTEAYDRKCGSTR